MAPVVDAWLRIRDHLSDDLLGGPKVVKLAWVINLQKGGTLAFVVGLMAAFGEFSTTAWVYAGLHGGYGLIWLIKEAFFPDPSWQRRITFGGALAAWLTVLGPYWVAPVLLVLNRHEAPPAMLGAALVAFSVGVVLMVGADAQKYFVLRERKGLITDGFFANTRNPNYLGEMLIYASFALVAGHWIPWAILAWVWLGLFVPNMLKKDARMARHPGFAAYRARTGLLLPRFAQGAAAVAPMGDDPQAPPASAEHA